MSVRETAEVEGKVVKVGDVVGFKSDIEQYAEIIKIEKNLGWPAVLTLKAPPDGFQGNYINGYDTTEVEVGDCWI